MINYYLLTKPGIILGNLITLAAGFLLASKGKFDSGLFFATLIGLTGVMASACVFNNYIDRPIDKKMERTKKRALVSGLISGRNAILFGIILGFSGSLILVLYTNLLTAFVAGVGFFIYVVLYSLWKRKTIHATAIGSIAGAVPPVVGYCAVSQHFDLGALILFIMLILWQMPHFFSIAILHYDDYVNAELPILPVIKGKLRTKIHMVVYIIGFIFAALMLSFFDYTGYLYQMITLSFGFIWLLLCIKGLLNHNHDQRWGRQMFRMSLLMIMAICFVIPFDVV